MRGSVPNRPSGMGPQARWCQWVHDSIFSFLRVGQVRGAKVSSTTGGVFVERWTRAAEVARASNSICSPTASNGDYFHLPDALGVD